MPYANDIDLSAQYLRTLIFGEAKTRKTTWACMAARSGYNVVLLDGDDGSQTVRELPLDVQKKILVVDVKDTFERNVFSEFCASFFRAGANFYWDEQAKIPVIGLKNPAHSFVYFNPMKLGKSDILIFDSWKAFVASTLFQFAKEHKIDLSDAEKEEWEGYGFQGRFQDYVMKCLHCLPCHIVVIGHETVYEKWDRRDKKNPKLLSRQTQIVSSSGPHAKTVMSHFTDILYFQRSGPKSFLIDAAGDVDRVGGSRLLEPKKYQWEDLPVDLLLQKIGAQPATEQSKGAVWYKSGAEISAAPQVVKPTPQTLEQPKNLAIQMPAADGPQKPLSLSERLALKKGGTS